MRDPPVPVEDERALDLEVAVDAGVVLYDHLGPVVVTVTVEVGDGEVGGDGVAELQRPVGTSAVRRAPAQARGPARVDEHEVREAVASLVAETERRLVDRVLVELEAEVHGVVRELDLGARHQRVEVVVFGWIVLEDEVWKDKSRLVGQRNDVWGPRLGVRWEIPAKQRVLPEVAGRPVRPPGQARPESNTS